MWFAIVGSILVTGYTALLLPATWLEEPAPRPPAGAAEKLKVRVAAPLPPLAFGIAETIGRRSSNVPHSPQLGQRPIHLVTTYPHSVHS